MGWWLDRGRRHGGGFLPSQFSIIYNTDNENWCVYDIENLRKPQALQSVLAPSGPRLHSGVSEILQEWQRPWNVARFYVPKTKQKEMSLHEWMCLALPLPLVFFVEMEYWSWYFGDKSVLANPFLWAWSLPKKEEERVEKKRQRRKRRRKRIRKRRRKRRRVAVTDAAVGQLPSDVFVAVTKHSTPD